MSKTTILIIVVAVLFLAAVGAALLHLKNEEKREVVNRYHGSEFNFTYPLELELEEYGNDSFSIGSTTQDGFDPAVQLTVMVPPADSVPDDFMIYAREAVLRLCDGEGTSCTAIESESRLRTPSSENVTVFNLTLVREVPGQEPETRTFGPVYTYVLGPNRTEGAPVFSALFVHYPLEAVLDGSADSAVLTRVNDSVTRGSKR